MRVTRVQTSQGHYVPPNAYRPQGGNPFRDVDATEVGSKGSIPGHRCGESLRWNPEIIIPEPEEEIYGTVLNGYKPITMMICGDCGERVPDTKLEDHFCGPLPTS